MKQFCSIHYFSYDSKKCPFCEQDRIKEMSKRYNKKHAKEGKTQKMNVSIQKLEELVEHFKNK